MYVEPGLRQVPSSLFVVMLKLSQLISFVSDESLSIKTLSVEDPDLIQNKSPIDT